MKVLRVLSRINRKSMSSTPESPSNQIVFFQVSVNFCSLTFDFSYVQIKFLDALVWMHFLHIIESFNLRNLNIAIVEELTRYCNLAIFWILENILSCKLWQLAFGHEGCFLKLFFSLVILQCNNQLFGFQNKCFLKFW